MNKEQTQPLLEVWLRDREEAPRDASAGLTQVMARVPDVRQRGRWWPLPGFDRPVSTSPTQELAPVPIPATNGRQPARGFTMFSAVKFVFAVVIVALFGGFLLTGALTTPQGDEIAPAAVPPSPSAMPDPASVVVIARWTSYTDLGTVVKPGQAYGVLDGVRGSMYWDATDVRLSGAATYIGRRHVYPKLYGNGLDAGIWTVENSDGTWRGESRGICTSSKYAHMGIWHGCHDQLVLTGEGTYEGLTAYLSWDHEDEEVTIRGLVLAEDWPELPEAAA